MADEQRRTVEPVMRTSAAPQSVSPLKKWLALAGLLLVVFLAGFIPQWNRARSLEKLLAEQQTETTKQQAETSWLTNLLFLQNSLANAAIDARRGEYEPARQAASKFFNDIRAELDKGNSSRLTAAQREQMAQLLAPRDEIITLLARNDPAAADRLQIMHGEFRKALSGTVTPTK